MQIKSKKKNKATLFPKRQGNTILFALNIFRNKEIQGALYD